MQAVILAALAIGPYSGVDVDSLLHTPALTHNPVLTLEAGQLVNMGRGMSLETRGAKPVAVTENGFALELDVALPAGSFSLALEASAPDRGTDSYYVDVDGVRGKQLLLPPVNRFGTTAVGLRFAEAGKHRFRISLREAPGSAIRKLEILRTTVRTARPPMREQLAGQHPRLLITAEQLPALRKRLAAPGTDRFYKLPGVLTRKPPKFRPGKRNGGAYKSLDSHALAQLLDPGPERLEGILAWLTEATAYGDVGVDLDAEYFMEGLALTYDWLYPRIPEPLRGATRDTIARTCRRLFDASLIGRTGGGLSFQQNHYWFAHLALALGAAAVYGEVPEAETWLAWVWDRYERIALTFSPDGSFHEGPAYWDYSMPTLYLFTDLYEHCTGIRAPAIDRGLKGQAEFRFHHLLPGLSRSAPLEDSKQSIGAPLASLFLWEAKRFRTPLVRGMADRLSRGARSDPANLLWLDPALDARDPLPALPPARYYQDVETVFMRTSWEEDATYAAFVSRPLGGHVWAELCSRYGLGGTGHNHPAQNHFILFARGEMLVGDPGYTYEKKTRNHNTILVDGQGQYGDGEMWPRPTPGRAHVTRFATSNGATIVTGEAASAYPETLGVVRAERTFVLAGPNLAVVCDRLETRTPRTFTWLLHSQGDIEKTKMGWLVQRNRARLGVRPLLPDRITAETVVYRPRFVHPTRDLTPSNPDINMLQLRSEPAQEAIFLVPLLIAGPGEEPPEVKNLSG